MKNDESMELPGGKFEVSVCGYAEVSWGGSTAKGEIYIVVNATSPTFGFNTVVVVVPVTVQIKGKASLQAGVEISYNWADATLICRGKFGVTVGLEAFGGVGIGKLVGVGAYGKASVQTEFNTEQRLHLDKIDLTGELGIKAYLACFTGEKAFAYNTWHLYTANQVLLSSADADTDLLEASAYYVDDMSYLSKESEWQGEPVSLMSAEAKVSLAPLLTGTYHNAQPVMVSGETALYAALVRGDAGGNIYLTATKYDGTVWAEPVRVDASAVCDSAPSLYAAEDGTLWLAYAKTEPDYEKNGLLSFARKQRIVVGTLDPDTLVFTEKAEFVGSGYLRMPQISERNGTITLAWLDSVVTDDNSVLNPAASAICLAEWDDGVWSEQETLTTVSAVVTQLCLGDAVGYVAEDKLYTVDRAGTVEMLAEDVHGRVSFGKLPQTTAKAFLWNGDGVLRSANGFVEAAGITKEYAVVGNSVYYSAAADGSANLAVTRYYSDGTHSEAICLTDEERYLENLSAAALNGTDYVLGMHTAAEITETSVEISKDLVWSSVAPVSDLRIDGLDYPLTDLETGVPVTLTVTNAGDHEIPGFAVSLNGSEIANGSALQPGESCDVAFHVTCPSVQTAYTVSVSRSGEEDYTPENNQAEMILGYADLSVALDYETVGNSQTLVATVINHGVDVSSGELVFCDAEGNTYGETTVGSLKPGDSCVIRYELEEAFAGKYGGEAGVSLRCAGEEPYTMDNTAWVVIPEQGDKVTVQEYGAGSVTVDVINTGNIANIACAFYDENGQLLTVKTETPQTGYSQCTFTSESEKTQRMMLFALDGSQFPLQAAQVFIVSKDDNGTQTP